MSHYSEQDGRIPNLAFDTEYQNKRLLIRAVYGVAVPIVTIIAVIDVMKGRNLIAILLAIILFVLVVALVSPYFRLKPQREYTVYYVTLTILSVAVGAICLLTIGFKGELSRLPWVYLYVVLVVNSFRFKTSLIWAGAFMILLIGVFFWKNQIGGLVADGFLLRFIGTYLFLMFSIALIKHKREQIQEKFVRNHDILQASESRLRETNTLLTEEIESRIQIEQALRQSEEQLARELKEKDILIKEIHHRVKNNMQIISSLLRLQIKKESKEEIKNAFQEAINRIAAMAMVHEEIYRSDCLAVIELAAYISSLTSGILGSYELNQARIALSLDLEEDIHVTPSFAVPFGLALNEMITNAVKHAFPEGTNGRLHVSVKRKGDRSIEFRVADSGVGFPTGYDPEKAETMGLYLVYRLLEGQLHGAIQINHREGTEYLITLPTGTI